MLKDYEVLVVEHTGRDYYSPRLKRYVPETERKWVLIEDCSSAHQAIAKASKTGRTPKGVRKFDPYRKVGEIEHLPLLNAPMSVNAVQIDELVMQKQQKKLDNKWKDKVGLWE